MRANRLDRYTRLGRAEGQRLATSLAKEFLANPDVDVGAFEVARVRELIEHLKQMLANGESMDAVEAYGHACSEGFSKALRERVETARTATKVRSS